MNLTVILVAGIVNLTVLLARVPVVAVFDVVVTDGILEKVIEAVLPL